MTVESITPAIPLRRTPVVWACWVSVLLSGFAGCRTARDNQIDILERELRTQEDYIYELEDYVCQYSERLRQYRCSEPMIVSETVKPTSVVKKAKPKPTPANLDQPLQMDEEPFDEFEHKTPVPSRPPTRRANPPAPVTPEETTPEELEPPELEIGEPVGQMDQDARVLRAVYTENEPLDAGKGISTLPPVVDTEPFAADEQVEPAAFEDERTAEQVVVTHLFHDEANEGAPAKLLAVVEARDAHDEPIEVDGEVSLMVMTADAKKPVRLKRWDFTAEDAASAWQSSHLGDGLHLELPLEETELPDAPLELWVRVVAPDGSKLLTQLPFEEEMLTALDSATSEERLAQRLSDLQADEPEGRLLSAEEPVDEESDSQPGWKPSLVRSDATPTGSTGTIGKPTGWTAQPPGGRFPGSQPAVAEPAVKQPIWTAGRVEPVSSTPTRRGTQSQWSPFR